MTVSRVSGGCLLAAEQMVAGRTGEGVDSPMFIAGYSTPMIDATFWFWSPSALRRRPLCARVTPRVHPRTTPTAFITAGPRGFLTLQISVPYSIFEVFTERVSLH